MVGCLLGTFAVLIRPISWEMERLLGHPPPRPYAAMNGLNGVWDLMATTVSSLILGGISVVTALFLLVLFRMLLRKPWAAATTVVIIVGLMEALQSFRASFSGAPIAIAGAAALVAVLVRFGVFAAIVGGFVKYLLGNFPVPSSLSAWYAGPCLFAMVVVAVIALYGFRCSLAGRPAFGQGLIRE